MSNSLAGHVDSHCKTLASPSVCTVQAAAELGHSVWSFGTLVVLLVWLEH